MPITLPVQPDAPITHRGITVVPLFPRCNPVAEYTTLETAIGRGFRVAESSDEGSVPELVVTNPPHRLTTPHKPGASPWLPGSDPVVYDG